jgi:hypothetical protein
MGRGWNTKTCAFIDWTKPLLTLWNTLWSWSWYECMVPLWITRKPFGGRANRWNVFSWLNIHSNRHNAFYLGHTSVVLSKLEQTSFWRVIHALIRSIFLVRDTFWLFLWKWNSWCGSTDIMGLILIFRHVLFFRILVRYRNVTEMYYFRNTCKSRNGACPCYPLRNQIYASQLNLVTFGTYEKEVPA